MQNYSGEEGLQYHLQIRKSDVGRCVIMPGDSKRCEEIAKHFDNARLVADSREHITYTGCLDEEKVSITSVGIGGLSTSIALEELVLRGVDTFIRVGICGGMEMNVRGGDIVIVIGAIRMEGTSKEHAPIEYSAVADLNVINVLVSAAKALGYTYHAGVTECEDALYGQYEPERAPVSYEFLNKWEAWKYMGYKVSKMESATLFTAASHLHARCGSDSLVVGSQERQNARLDSPIVHDTKAVIKAVVGVIRRPIKEDRS